MVLVTVVEVPAGLLAALGVINEPGQAAWLKWILDTEPGIVLAFWVGPILLGISVGWLVIRRGEGVLSALLLGPVSALLVLAVLHVLAVAF
ncbi:MAG: hypothetical protein ACXWDM_13425 [Nocardioides sp.]